MSGGACPTVLRLGRRSFFGPFGLVIASALLVPWLRQAAPGVSDQEPHPTVSSVSSQRSPEARAHHQLTYHAGHGRPYLIGGSTPRGDGYHYFTDVWTWSGGTWKPLRSLPFPRSSHRIVYDASRRSLVMFGGGFSRAVRAEGVLWEWRGEGWRALGGQLDAGRNEPGMCYDRRRKRIVIFGGWDETSTFRGDTWEWTGEELLRVDSIGPGTRPAPRAGHAFLYDPSHGRCLLYGGRGADGWLADTWAWNGSGWRRLEVAGPSARWFFGAAADPVNERIVVFGGAGADGDHGDTWAWDGDRWTRIATTGPPARSMAKLAFDGVEGILLFGGRRRTDTGFVDLADTWILHDGTWQRP